LEIGKLKIGNRGIGNLTVSERPVGVRRDRNKKKAKWLPVLNIFIIC